jgi:hypothetical protein
MEGGGRRELEGGARMSPPASSPRCGRMLPSSSLDSGMPGDDTIRPLPLHPCRWNGRGVADIRPIRSCGPDSTSTRGAGPRRRNGSGSRAEAASRHGGDLRTLGSDTEPRLRSSPRGGTRARNGPSDDGTLDRGVTGADNRDLEP